MLLLNKTVKTVQYPTCISFIENKNKKFYQSLKQKAEHLQLTCGSGAESMHLWMQKIMTFLKK